MKTQIYTLDTCFNFGKHERKSLRRLLELGESRYIGYLIANNHPYFILHPETLSYLDKAGLFEDLHMSERINGGSIPLSSIGITKENILDYFKERYEAYISDPVTYKENNRTYMINVRKDLNEKKLNKLNNQIEGKSSNDYYEEDDPIEFGSPQDPNENPWKDVLRV